MQTFRPAVVPLLIVLFCAAIPGARPCFAAKFHSVTLGAVRKVPYTPAEASAATKDDDSATLKVRPLLVDGAQKEWTLGDSHDVTDRSFVVRRALRINDALPSEPARWSWQPGPWLLVDRVTGRITALHLPDFDADVSNVVWYRDYAAYCGIATTARGGLFAIVAELGGRRAVVSKEIGPWPQANHFIPVCQAAEWQRMPMRVTIKPTGPGEAVTFNVVGTSSLIEEGDLPESPPPR